MSTTWLVLAFLGGALLLVSVIADSVELDLPGTDAVVPGEAIAAFLAAAGVIGYALDTSGVGLGVTLPAALGAGAGMGAVVLAMVRWLMTSPTDATPTEADFVGAIGRVVTPIRPGGIGEIMVSRHGQPWKVAAQLTDAADHPVAAGTEVVVVQVISATRVLVTPYELDAGGTATVAHR